MLRRSIIAGAKKGLALDFVHLPRIEGHVALAVRGGDDERLLFDAEERLDNVQLHRLAPVLQELARLEADLGERRRRGRGWRRGGLSGDCNGRLRRRGGRSHSRDWSRRRRFWRCAGCRGAL